MNHEFASFSAGAAAKLPASNTFTDHGLLELCSFFAELRRKGGRAVLATIVRTEGSTYRKAGAQILISEGGTASGLLSGGCLETDLHERAWRVLKAGRPERVVFDSRAGVDDTVFGIGIGAGCEGANDIWLQVVSAENEYGPLPYFMDCLQRGRCGRVAMIIGGDAGRGELGRHCYPGTVADDLLSRKLLAVDADPPRIAYIDHDNRRIEAFFLPVVLPPALLICGGGPDARPVAQLATALGWRVTVYDHRPFFANAELFPESTKVVSGRAEQLIERAHPDKYDAAIIMSHHLPADIAYLRCLAMVSPAFIGILGPAARRARLFAEVGSALMEPLKTRVHGPVGLDIGAKTPAGIALSIIAEIHAVLAGRPGRSLSASPTI